MTFLVSQSAAGSSTAPADAVAAAASLVFVPRTQSMFQSLDRVQQVTLGD